MFEKEAEEYQTEKRKTFNEYEQLCWGDVYKDFKKGAEFGYNKGRNEAKEIIKDLLNLPFASNEEVFADVGSHLYKAEQFIKDSEVEK